MICSAHPQRPLAKRSTQTVGNAAVNTSLEHAVLGTFRRATPIDDASRAAVKTAVCDYVTDCRARGMAPQVVLRMVKQLATDALDYGRWESSSVRTEAYGFVSQVAPWCIDEHYRVD